MRKQLLIKFFGVCIIVIPLLFGLFVIQLIKLNIIQEPYIYLAQGLVTIQLFFFIGILGLLWIIQGEALQIAPVRGKQGIALGLILIVGSWGLVVYSVVLLALKYTV